MRNYNRMPYQMVLRLVLLALLILLGLAGFTQSIIKLDSSGNYSSLKSLKHKDTVKVSTGKTYTDYKGNKYNVYTTNTGRLYVIRTSKNTGKDYKQYLKLD